MVLVNPSGPHQFTICAGLAHASHNSSTGAPTVLMVRISLFAVVSIDYLAVGCQRLVG
jgi:hypothetical protein